MKARGKKQGSRRCSWVVHNIGTVRVFFLSNLVTDTGRDLGQFFFSGPLFAYL